MLKNGDEVIWTPNSLKREVVLAVVVESGERVTRILCDGERFDRYVPTIKLKLLKEAVDN